MSAASMAANSLWALLNSNFSAALAGAGVGAYAAHWITSRSERRRRLLEEIRATNASINLAFVITNTFCNLKVQHVRRLVADYEKQRAEFQAAQLSAQLHRGVGQPAIVFKVDFQTLAPPATPLDVLQGMLFEKVTVTGRALIAFTTLTQAVTGLSQALELRNEIAMECRSKSPTYQALAALYFGVADSEGRIDERYRGSMKAISTQLDDCIFFCNVLMGDLVRHGIALADEVGEAAPKIHKPDFSKAIENDLIPSDALYAEWLAGFNKSELVEARDSWVERWSAALGDA